MKLAVIVLLGTFLTMLAGCESDMSGPRQSSRAVQETSFDAMQPRIARGDVYFETYIGRYDLTKD